MIDIKLKVESLPERCEICHQSDYFDQLQNYCSRCSNNNIRDVVIKESFRNIIKTNSLILDNHFNNNKEIIPKWRIIISLLLLCLSIILCMYNVFINSNYQILGVFWGL